MKRKLKFKKIYKEKLKKEEYVKDIANFVKVTPTTIRNWIDSDNLKIYSYPIVRHIAILFNVKIEELFDN